MEVAIRFGASEDLPFLVALYEQLNPGDPQAPHERLAAVLLEILSSPHFDLVVAELNGEIVGTCYLNVIPNLTRGASPYAVVENVVVTREFRDRGIGKAVVRFALARAWERGCYKAMLQTGSKSEAKHNFYRSCGFSQTEKVAFVARPHTPLMANPSVKGTSSGGLRPPESAPYLER